MGDDELYACLQNYRTYGNPYGPKPKRSAAEKGLNAGMVAFSIVGHLAGLPMQTTTQGHKDTSERIYQWNQWEEKRDTSWFINAQPEHTVTRNAVIHSSFTKEECENMQKTRDWCIKDMREHPDKLVGNKLFSSKLRANHVQYIYNLVNECPYSSEMSDDFRDTLTRSLGSKVQCYF